jgi:excisionase family DNA binding protein
VYLQLNLYSGTVVMTELGRALLDQLGPDDLEQLAERLAPFLRPAPAPAEDGWLTTKQAAGYLGITANALHKLTAERSIPFSQSAPGARCFFRRSDLDEWRREA